MTTDAATTLNIPLHLRGENRAFTFVNDNLGHLALDTNQPLKWSSRFGRDRRHYVIYVHGTSPSDGCTDALTSNGGFRSCVIGGVTRAVKQYSARLEELQGYAAEDGIEVNENSLKDFLEFVGSTPSARRGNLVLLENGNLRLIWKDPRGNHVGIQFRGDNLVQYVVFKLEPNSEDVLRAASTDTLEGVKSLIRGYNLEALTGHLRDWPPLDVGDRGFGQGCITAVGYQVEVVNSVIANKFTEDTEFAMGPF